MPKFLLIIICHAVAAGLVMVAANQSVWAERLPGAFIDSPASLSSLACRQYLSGKGEESLALYQKAVEKAEADYGKDSPLVGSLSYEMGVRAYDLSKFDLAEHCLKKAVAVDPNCLAAQLMLGRLLRFRDKNNEAYQHIQQVLKKHWDSPEARRDLMLCLQDADPASAAQQAFIINCLQTGAINKIPGRELPAKAQKPEKPAESTVPNKPAAASTTTPARATSGITTQANLPGQANNPAGKQNHTNASELSNIESRIQWIEKALKGNNKPASRAVTSSRVRTKAVNKVAKGGREHKTTAHTPSLLVPPPPLPAWFGFPTGKPGAPSNPPAGLKAKADSIKAENSAPEKKKKSKTETTKPAAEEAVKRPSGEGDSDFLLDWAAIKKKTGKK